MNLQKSLFLYILVVFTTFSCSSNSKKNQTTNKTEEKEVLNTKFDKSSFNAVKDITFYEVKRLFDNGLSYDTTGFRQKAEWLMQFNGKDSVRIYGPTEKKMLTFYLHHDHANYFHFGMEWFAAKHISKDSLILQRLDVKNMKAATDKRSNVYMTFYSEEYLNKNNLKKEALQAANSKDTALVKSLIAKTNAKPLDSNYLFAATHPVVFKSKHSNISAEKFSSFNDAATRASYDYLYPEYRINIKKAYKQFNVAYRAIVDTTGKITVYDFPSYETDKKTIEAKTKVYQAINDVYLSNMLEVVPGNTLGFKHASLITLYVKGEM